MSDSDTSESEQYYSEGDYDDDNDDNGEMNIVEHNDEPFDIPEEVLKFLDYQTDEENDTNSSNDDNNTLSTDQKIKPMMLFGAKPNPSLQKTLFGDTPTVAYTYAPVVLYVVVEQMRNWQDGNIITTLHPHSNEINAQKYANYINNNTICQLCNNKKKGFCNECMYDNAYVDRIDLSTML